jgi:hypothetical protein
MKNREQFHAYISVLTSFYTRSHEILNDFGYYSDLGLIPLLRNSFNAEYIKSCNHKDDVKMSLIDVSSCVHFSTVLRRICSDETNQNEPLHDVTTLYYQEFIGLI